MVPSPRLARFRLACLAALLWLAGAAAARETVFPAPSGAPRSEIVIYSSLDTALAVPLVDAFQALHPDTALLYVELLTGAVAERVRAETGAGQATADLAISSAMDLQVKLANDGFARPVDLPAAAGWPRWANWRDTAFAITVEPAVIVYHRPSFPDGPPATRAALIDWLDSAPDPRIGTYDIASAGVGYLFLSRDQEHFADVWNLVAAMGRAGVALYPTSHQIIEAVAAGDLLVGYNVLGSYAEERAADLPDLGILLPRDFAVAIGRVALVPQAAANPEGGAAFLSFLMSAEGQSILSRDLHFPPVDPAVVPAGGQAGGLAAMMAAAPDSLRPVPVSPGLLAYADQSRRRLFLSDWAAALAP